MEVMFDWNRNMVLSKMVYVDNIVILSRSITTRTED